MAAVGRRPVGRKPGHGRVHEQGETEVTREQHATSAQGVCVGGGGHQINSV